MYNHASQSNFRRIILFVLVFCSFVSFGQNAKFSVSGSVLDEKNSSMPFASVALYRADSSLFGGSTTEINGSFKINNVPSGDYFLKISFVGYNAFSKEITVNQNLNLGKMQLTAGVELDAFVVRESYIPVQTIEDTVIFAADAFSPPEGSALEELLKRFPGAEVDKDGKITVNGKEISKILVNGKKFFDDDPKIASKNLPANIVDKVQFFEKASDQSQFSGIDDGESENVINLITKPGMQKGVFGNVTLAGGTNMPPMLGTWSDWKFENDFRFNNSISLNYFKDGDQLSLVGSWNNCNNVGFTDMMNSSSSMMFGGRRRGGGGNTSAGIANSASIGLNFSKEFSPKVTAGGDYQFGYTKNFAETETFRENLYNSGNTFYNENNTATTTSMQHRLRFEVNYKIDTNNTLNFRPNISFANSNKDQIGTHNLFDAENSLLNTGIEESFSKSWSLESRLEVQYQHKFQKPRRTLWISLNGGLRTGKGLENNITQNIFYDGGEESDSINKETNSVSNRYNYAAYFGYTEPLTKRATLELRYSFSQTNESKDQKALNYDYLTGDYSLLDTNYSTFYSNHFMQHRLEARVQWQFEKLNFSIGMGAYPSISDNILSSGEPYKQTVWNYSPSARLQFRPSKTETLRLFYNGRATQPSMSQLQPVPDNTDALDIKLGNLDLLPSFQHGLRTIYNKTFKTTASLFAMLMGNVVQNGIAGVTITDPSLYPELKLAELPKGAQYTRYENIPLTYNARANATFNTPIVTSKFNVSITGNVAYTNNKSIIDKKINTTDNISGGGMLKFTFRITTFDVSLNGRANVTKAMYSLQPERNMLYNTLSGGLDFNWTIFKGFILSSDFAYQKQNGYSDNYNPQTFMWNAQVSYTFGKRNEWSMRLRAIDLLNNNVNVVRNVNSQYYEDIRYNSLGRYVLLGITYNLNAKLAKEETDKAIENFRSGNPPPRGGGRIM